MIEENIIIRFLIRLGIIQKKPISNKEMCERSNSICNHKCNVCAWGGKSDE